MYKPNLGLPSEDERKRFTPPPLESLVDALHDPIHQDVGRSRPAKAIKILKQAPLNRALALVQLLPLSLPSPTVESDPDGGTSLEWYQNPKWVISVTIAPDGVLYYAALLGDFNPRGSSIFSGEIPPQLLELIQQFASA